MACTQPVKVISQQNGFIAAAADDAGRLLHAVPLSKPGSASPRCRP
jgi:hypothetical protein